MLKLVPAKDYVKLIKRCGICPQYVLISYDATPSLSFRALSVSNEHEVNWFKRLILFKFLGKPVEINEYAMTEHIERWLNRDDSNKPAAVGSK